MSKNIILKYKTVVNPYAEPYWIVVAHSVLEAQNEMASVFGPVPKGTQEARARSISGSAFGMIFGTAGLGITHGTIAHEVFHSAHQILDWAGDKFSIKHQEPYAWIVDWLTDEVYAQFKKAGIRIR